MASAYLLVEDVKSKKVYVYDNTFNTPIETHYNAFVYVNSGAMEYDIFHYRPEDNSTSHTPSATTDYNQAYYLNLYEHLSANTYTFKLTQYIQVNPDLNLSGGSRESDQNTHVYRNIVYKNETVRDNTPGGSGTINVSRWDVVDRSIENYYDGMVVSVRVPTTLNITGNTSSYAAGAVAFQINKLGYRTVLYDTEINNNYFKKCLAGTVLFFVYNSGIEINGLNDSGDSWEDKKVGVWQNITIASIYEFTGGGGGLQGIQGLQGIYGIQGIQGLQGIQGIQGTQGTQGTQGLQGTQGTRGIQGIQGDQGTQGIQGTYGIQGIQGIEGLTDYNFTHITNTTVTSPFTFTCAANQRNSQTITTGANLTLNITCNNGSDNYLWIINSSSANDIDVVLGTVTYNGTTLTHTSIIVPPDGITVPKSGFCEISIIMNDDGCVITTRNDLVPST
jgi:hypothetical protein